MYIHLRIDSQMFFFDYIYIHTHTVSFFWTLYKGTLSTKHYLESQWRVIMVCLQRILGYFVGIVACYFGLFGFPGTSDWIHVLILE